MVKTMKFVKSFSLVILIAWTGKAAAGPILDVAILMDSSGSLGSTGWAQEQSAVQDYIDRFPLMNVRFGIVQFATGANTLYTFADDQDRSTIKNFVANLPFTSGSTYTKDAIEEALDLFEQWSSDDNLRAITMFTDGNPTPTRTQSPCSLKNNLDNEGVYTNVLAIGDGVSQDKIDCLLDDLDNDFILVEDFSEFSPVLGDMVAQTQMVPAPLGGLTLLVGLFGLLFTQRK